MFHDRSSEIFLFKYIYKGHSCVRVSVNLENQNVLNYNEINGYLNARCVGPCEAFHRLYAYHLHGCSHCIYRLPIHLQDMQNIYYLEGEEEEALAKEAVARTQLAEWFE